MNPITHWHQTGKGLATHRMSHDGVRITYKHSEYIPNFKIVCFGIKPQ